MKTVLITGASGNLGKACVEKFLTEGYKVLVTVGPGQTLGNDLKGIETFEADLTNEASVEKVINEITQSYKIDATLLLVGGFAIGNIKDTNGAALQKMFSLNFDTAYFVARPIFNHMMKQSTGRIVFIGARPALNPADGKSTIAYALSKSLVFKLAELLNAEGASNNVVSQVIVPSIIDTPANRASMPTANFSDWVKPEAIAETIFYLCSEKGSAIRDTVVKLYGKS
jgi:NAD(P)-dependent dehydrogenase (short-subunit alcohol dehydrogenase family)